ncbi:MAG: DNA translocase FtsK, partial [Chloroflexota bacterium]
KDGGLIGWGVAELFYITISSILPMWLADLIVPIILIGLIYVGLRYAFPNFSIPTEGFIRKSISKIPNLQVDDSDEGEVFSSATQAELPLAAKKKGTARKKQANIPAEFRKQFRVEEGSQQIEELPERDNRLPPLERLADEKTIRPNERQINLTAGLIEKTLAEFGVPSKVVDFQVGPTVTQFAIEPGYIEKPGRDGQMSRQKIRVSQISALQRDLALALSAQRLRIQAPVPGRSFVGIEVPNLRSNVVRLRPILESEKFYSAKSSLALALGRDVSGQTVIADLAKMPHLLIAGTTGSGKSVCISAITVCLAMNNTPDDLQLIMIDPKMVELVPFNGLPHLIGKVETDINRISAVLRWVVLEMDKRYKQFEELRARDLEGYNRKARRRTDQDQLPRIVVLIDELADLMMNSAEHTEATLVRLAQMGRATGIHLVVATQRPSTDVVTGLIKANFPARLSFAVASGIDSRVILDESGAETLLGRGDMLYLSPEAGSAIRSQGVMISDQEIENVISYWQKSWHDDTEQASPWEELMIVENERDGRDELVDRAIEVLRETGNASASHLQRKLHIGYPRAARLMDELEDIGIVGPTRGGGREREVLLEFDEDVDDQL